MRNKFEHIDEKLDDWWKKDPSHIIFDQMIGDPLRLGAANTKQIFRGLNPVTGAVYFWGTEYALPGVVRALDDLYGSAATYLEALTTWPHGAHEV